MKEDIELKTTEEVDAIRAAASVVELVLAHLRQSIIPGRSTSSVEAQCAALLTRHNAMPESSQTGGFPAAACISVNNVIAHGIPGDYVLAEGDIVTVDVTACVNGWYADGAWTYVAGTPSDESLRLIQAAWSCTMSGLRAAHAGGRLGDIGAAVQQTAHQLHCSVLAEFAGHGIGRRMHESPTVLHEAEQGTGLPVVPGLVFTVEPIVCFGTPTTRKLDDGWTYVADDGTRTAQFEHTIAIFSRRTEILTMSNALQYVDFPPFF